MARPAWLQNRISRHHAKKSGRDRKAVKLSPRAVKEFEDRKRRDLRKYKELTDDDLWDMMEELPERPPIWTKLRHLQRTCLLIGIKLRRCAFFNDTGTGKTLLGIALTRYFQRTGDARCALVLVPVRVNKAEWAREIAKHSKSSQYVVLEGSSANKWQQLEENPDASFVIETYAGWIRMLCTLKEGKRGKNKLTPNPTLIKRFAKRVQIILTDEGTILGRKDNLPRRLVRQMIKDENQLYFTFTGTPFGRDPALAWSQMWLVDGGWSLGETLGLFRAAFYKAKDNFWGGTDYTFDKSRKALLHDYLAHASIRYKVNEADLPKCVEIPRYVELDADADTWAQRAKEALQAAKGNFREQKNAFLRLRQISSGFIGYMDEDKGERAEFVFDQNPKLEMLLSIIEGIDPEHKIIVFCDFHYSTELIASELKAAKIGHLQIYGKTKQPEKALAAFDADPDKQVLILSNAMAIGLNLQVARYGIFYESPVPAIMRKQARRRFERQESKHDTVFLYDLIVRGTADQRILDMHAEGDDLFKAIVEGRAKL